MTGKKTIAGDKLDAVFKVVVEEAHANAGFADRLRDAINGPQPKDPKASAPKTKAAPVTKATTSPEIHAVNVLRQHGEQMLRGRLSNLRTKSDLTQVAKRSGLRLTGRAAKKTATRPDLIDGIIEAAKQYDRQRESVEG